MAITVLQKNRVSATIKVTGTGSQTITLASLARTDETVATPKVDIHEVMFAGNQTAKTLITRNSVDVLALTGTGHWEFNGMALSENNGSDIVVNIGDTNGTVILVLKKIKGYAPTVDSQVSGYNP